MNKFILSIVLVFTASVCSNVFAQQVAPAGAGDKNLGDNNVKLRSVELEKVKRDAEFARASSYAPISKDIAKTFPQIKEDFESVQVSQGEIIKAYTTGKTIDYGKIESSASDINKKAKRLDSNLFATKLDESFDEATLKKLEKMESVRDLIVALDTAIGSFVSSKVFGNIKVIEPDVAIKTRNDLDHIEFLSEKLSKEAKKMK